MGKRGGRRARRGGNNGGGRGATGSNRQAVAGVDARDAPNAGSNGQVPYESYQVVLENKSFEDYYKAQNIVPSDQWDDFMASLRKPLPVSFRFTGSRNHAQDLREYMKKEYFPKLKGFAIEGEEVQPPEPVPWYPNDLAWVFDCGRTALRKSPQVNDFHRFLVSETEVGNISRQEVVSMVPVFFLDVKPGHKVLDMCAAPGSKTAQLLEAVHANENETAGESMPDGLVVANDSDYDRAMMLVHQAKRLQSPCLLVTNHEGQEFPRIFLSDRESEKGSTVLQFDRILCDVPCSGDGTLRKNKTIWRSYSIGNGNGLHRIQKSVLLRGCELLKVGGRLVYSTCTFNPIENEAVLASIINETNGAFRLVDASDILPDLVRHKGLSTWKPHDKSGKPLEAYDPSNPAIQESFFPPSNAATLGLEHCMRIYPLPQNGGGFFVAVLEKTGPYGALDRFSVFGGEYQPTEAEKLAAKAKAEAEADAEAQAKADGAATDKAPAKRPSEDNISSGKETKHVKTNDGTAAPAKRGWSGSRESPFIFVDSTNPVVAEVTSFYGISDKFPRDQFVVRTENDQDDFRSIYLVSPPIKEILLASNANRLKVVNTGVKVFKRNGGDAGSAATAGCPYRVSSEGVQTIAPFLSPARQITLGLEDLCVFIKHEYPHFSEFSAVARERFSQLAMGSCLLRFEPLLEPDYTGSVSVPIVLPFFRAKTSGSLLLSKKERSSLLHRLKGEAIIEFQSVIQVPKDSTKGRGGKGRGRKGTSAAGTATTSGADTPVDGDSEQVALAEDDGDLVDRLMEADA